MAPIPSTLRQLAVLGARPAFPPGEPVPLIYTQGNRPKGDFNAIDMILANDLSDKSRASQQRFVAKILPGVERPGPSFRTMLQRRIRDALNLDSETSVICVTSGTNALRAVLKGVRAGASGASDRNEIIVPQTTVGATVEAVIAENFIPVFVGVDSQSWLLSPELTERSISGKTAAIITVEWLGTQCCLGPFRKMADKHGIQLISDSAQSFGATDGTPPTVSLADATIYSLGYPKVFTGAGSGGLIVCPKSLADLLENDPTGILRHEVLPEINAACCLQALESIPKALETRRAAGNLYRRLLANIAGITFQQIPAGLGTNYYQVSFTVDAKAFGLNARQLCWALKAENIHCSTERMPCVAANNKFAAHGRVEGDLEHSRLLAATSVTLPISNIISPETVKAICGRVKLIHKKAYDVLAANQNPEKFIIPPSQFTDVIDFESKYHNHLVLSVLNDASGHSKVLIPYDYLRENSISPDEFLERFVSRQQWGLDDCVFGDLRVDAIIGSGMVVVLAQRSHGQLSSAGNPLDESGSSATVTLMPKPDGQLVVRKWAMGYGIDGNGAPWLRRQSLFLNASQAVKKTGMFVQPTKVIDSDRDVTLELPYIASHSFGELIFANAGSEPVVNALVAMLARMATSVWTEGQEQADSDFIEKAHFGRMRRRLEIARAQDGMLDTILGQKTVKLNGRQLDGFDTVLKKLEQHPLLAAVEPTILTEIHGDLNVHNALCRLDPNDEEDVALIDPRGVPLLGGSEDGKFERGDYCYDVSKLLFSLTGFSDIRKRRFEYSSDGVSHELNILRHPGSDTMNGAAAGLIPAVASNKEMMEWINEVEKGGIQSFELRVRVGEAAHFVADCACALGRDTRWEIVPLFLMGLEKLNDAVALLDGDVPLSAGNRPSSPESLAMPESPDFGAATIQQALFRSHTSNEGLPYDVLEISVKAESAATSLKQLREMVGIYFPRETGVWLSTDPVDPSEIVTKYPCVLIHPSNGVRGQTHMLAAAARRTTAFLRDTGLLEEVIDNLKIVHISSTGSSSRSQFSARANDKLLSPGTFGISPLQLAVLQANQLPFPKPGRWVIENDSFFLLSRPLSMGGKDLCLLAIKRPTSGSSSSWRVHIDDTEEKDGLLFAKSFQDIGEHEMGKSLLRTTTGLFLPHRLADTIALKEVDYAERTSPLLIDIVLPRFMKRADWIKLSHQQGYGVNSHRAWENAQSLQHVCKRVELANGGDKMAFYHYGSDEEYSKLLASVRADARLNSLAYAGAAVKWLLRLKSKGMLSVT